MGTKSKNIYILGITGLSHAFHDNSAVVLKNGEVIFAASEERYSRIKHDRDFPARAIKHALKFTNISKNDADYVAIGYPKRFFLQPFFSKNTKDFFKILFNWLKGRRALFFQDVFNILRGEVKQNFFLGPKGNFFKNDKLVYVDHHLAHAASAYFTSGYGKCLAVCMDAFGPKASGKIISGAVYLCDNKKIERTLEEIDVISSIGLFYTSITQALGFTPGDGEGKTMGLAAYGNPKLAYRRLKRVAPSFKRGKWRASPYWAEMFFANRKEFRPIFNSLPIGIFIKELVGKYGKENIAAAAQRILEEEVVKFFSYLISKYKVGNFALAGGIFLNVKMNKKILELKGVEDIFIHPNAGDGGTALGAALQVYSEKYGFLKSPKKIRDVSWGTGYSQIEIEKMLKKYKKKIVYTKHKNIAKTVAERLIDGKVVGWFQGRFEWGPRALGYRSVLVDPRRVDIKDKLNNTLKNREWFMPFAPSVLEEFGKEYFNNYKESPFMTIAFDVKKEKIKDIKAAIHMDNTARPNMVNKKDNPLYHRLIKEFYKLTKVPVVLNTSFNKHGLPIIDSPKDAINHLLWNCVDTLAIGSYLVIRR